MERPAIELADIFRRHGSAYLRDHAGQIGRGERRVMGAIAACRTAALGSHVEQCDDCGARRIAYNSCRNRHCPKCQGAARAAWLDARKAEVAFQNKRLLYAALMRAAAEATMTLAANPKRLGAKIGLLAVLHTWGQTLTHHPHVHCVVPGGGVSLDGERWIVCKPGFFLPVKAMARLFRRLFLAAALFRRAGAVLRTTRFRRAHRRASQGGLDRLRQAAFRRPRAGARLSRALPSPRSDRQFEARRRRHHRSSGRAEGPHMRGFVDRRNWRRLPLPRLRRTHAPHRHRSAREPSPVPMRHVMSPAIVSARNSAQRPVSLVARYADGASPRAPSTRIFIIMTSIPRQTATNSGLFDRFPLTRRVLVSRHKHRRPPRPCAKRRRDALSP